MLARHRVRAAVNWMNLATPAGFLIAHVAATTPRRTRSGLWLAHGYRPRLPTAAAFTMGNVILLRASTPPPGVDPVGSVGRHLLDHEERHATQYAALGGLLMPVWYSAAALWSWWRTGDRASANVFERHAGLADGGYVRQPPRPPLSAGSCWPSPSLQP